MTRGAQILSFGTTQFCDDIRYEADGKRTFVGVYSGAMYVNTDFPVVLPKLGLAIRYVQAVEDCPEKAEIVVTIPGGEAESPAFRAEITLKKDGEIIESGRYRPDGKESVQIATETTFTFSPLVILQAGVIQVTARTEKGDIDLGRLYVLRGK
jgi:hypothetical protein